MSYHLAFHFASSILMALGIHLYVILMRRNSVCDILGVSLIEEEEKETFHKFELFPFTTCKFLQVLICSIIQSFLYDIYTIRI